MKNPVLLLLLFVIPFISYAQGPSLVNNGVRLNLKSKSPNGKNATIFNYCQDVKLSKNCQELIITNSGHKLWLPFKSGPLNAVLKTGKTNNYDGLTPVMSKQGKIQGYYTYNKTQLYILIPIGKMSSYIGIYNSGIAPLPSSAAARTRQEDILDIVDCILNYCGNKASDCISNVPTSLPSAEKDSRYRKCFEEEDACKQTCKDIEMEKTNTIVVFRKTNGINDFQMVFKN